MPLHVQKRVAVSRRTWFLKLVNNYVINNNDRKPSLFHKKEEDIFKNFFKCLCVDLPQNLIISEVHVDISVKSRFHEELGLSLFMFS